MKKQIKQEDMSKILDEYLGYPGDLMKKIDDRKKILIHYRVSEQGKIEFIDPSCDELPMELFGELLKAIDNVQKEYNKGK